KNYEPYSGKVTVTVPPVGPAEVIDLDTGKTLLTLPAGAKGFTIKFKKQLARAIYIKPAL
ncbi:hypothetical protein LLG95_06495, partial [bacterium]|nr:hypothetical protein [bacterium]